MRKIFIDWLPYILCMCKPDHPKTPKPKVLGKSIAPIHRLSTIPMLNLPRVSQTTFPDKNVFVYHGGLKFQILRTAIDIKLIFIFLKIDLSSKINFQRFLQL